MQRFRFKYLIAVLVVGLVAAACGDHLSSPADQTWQDSSAQQTWAFRHNHGIGDSYQAGAWRDVPQIYVRGDVIDGNSWDLFYTRACFTVGHNDVGMEGSSAHKEQLYAEECFTAFTPDVANWYTSIHAFLHEEGHLDILESNFEYQLLAYTSQPRRNIFYHNPDNSDQIVNGINVCGRQTNGAKNVDCVGV